MVVSEALSATRGQGTGLQPSRLTRPLIYTYRCADGKAAGETEAGTSSNTD